MARVEQLGIYARFRDMFGCSFVCLFVCSTLLSTN